MSSRSLLFRQCLRKSEKWRQLPIIVFSRSYRQAYSTPASTSTSKRKWRDIAISFTVGFAIITAYKSYTSDSQNYSFLNPTTFSGYVLIEKQPVSKTSSIFTLSPTTAQTADPIYKDAWKRGIWSVEFKQPQLQIARAYTPLPPALHHITKDDEEDLRFLIRRDPDGEVSSYLHHLHEGASIEVRGPNLEYEIPTSVQKVLFLAGGTGIAPALQVAHCLLEARKRKSEEVEEDEEEAKIHILWANRRREDCNGGLSDRLLPVRDPWWKSLFLMSNNRPELGITARGEMKTASYIVKELEALKAKHPSQLTVEYFVDEEGSFITEQALSRTIAELDCLDRKPQPHHQITQATTTQIMLSGPDGFISHLAGPKANVWRNKNGRGEDSQGPLGGVLHRLGLSRKDVWKL